MMLTNYAYFKNTIAIWGADAEDIPGIGDASQPFCNR
jgi:hypothetical protein